MRISIPLVVKALSRFLPAEERTRRKTAKLAGKRAHESCNQSHNQSPVIRMWRKIIGHLVEELFGNF